MRSICSTAVASCFLAFALSASAGAQGGRVIDRVLAVVDDDPILQSEVDQVLALRGEDAVGEASDLAVRRTVLDQLIEQRLGFHEIDSFGFVELPAAEIEKGLEEIRSRFASEQGFQKGLESVGLEEETLRQLVARQLMVLLFVQERLGPRIFVDLGDIRTYYEETLRPEMARQKQSLPALASVREQIRGVLREQRLNEEIERWTEELRQAADVEDYFESVEGELPGVVASSGPDE